MTHTPGPWHVEPRERDIWDVRNSDEHIARVMATRIPHARGDADARLIAAAPDLYTSLRELEHMLQMICEEVCLQDPPPSGVATLARARVALRKAEGTTAPTGQEVNES